MTVSALAKKLHIRPASTIAYLNAPSDMAETLVPLLDGARAIMNT
jgi:hypothetical protein